MRRLLAIGMPDEFHLFEIDSQGVYVRRLFELELLKMVAQLNVIRLDGGELLLIDTFNGSDEIRAPLVKRVDGATKQCIELQGFYLIICSNANK